MIFKFKYFWGPEGSILHPLSFLLFGNKLPKSNFMKATLFADDTVIFQSDNHLGKLENSVNCEMTKLVDYLTANNSHIIFPKQNICLSQINMCAQYPV